MADPILELRAITKSFFGVKALRGVTFDLRPGEVHAVVGENGAGKSTLIKVIAGAHRPDGGEMVVQGRTVAGLEPAEARRLGIACIYQQPALFPDLTVAENIALRLAPERGLRRIDWRARRGQAAALLGRIGADLSPDREVRRLSMPEQQLVEIACALGTGARIVIMDEPTASLTQKEQHLLFSIVRKLCALGAGVIYISHRLDEVLTLADRISVLRDGAHLGTFAAGEIDEPRLIRLMVGREVEPLGPPKGATAGEAVLQARGLGCAAPPGFMGSICPSTPERSWGWRAWSGPAAPNWPVSFSASPRPMPARFFCAAGRFGSARRPRPSPLVSPMCRRTGGGRALSWR